MAGTILILCSTGKTGARLAKLLHASGHHSLVLASRKGLIPAEFSGSGSPSVKAVKFDWTDPSSFGNAFALDSNIDQVYLVGPDVVNMLPPSKLFIDLAIDRGVKNFVLLSATTCEKGGPAMGEIHGYLDQIGVGYIALRPTWFIENFTDVLLKGITEDDEIVSTAGDGKMFLVSCDDIAEAARDAFEGKLELRTDYPLLGPEAFSYADAAEVFTSVLGRKIVHRKLTLDEGLEFWKRLTGEEMAKTLVAMEQLIANGVEYAAKDLPRVISGKVTLKDWIVANKELFVKKA